MESARPKVFHRPDPSKATGQDRRRAFRILRRDATNPIEPDSCKSAEDYKKIQEDIAWAKQVFPDFNLDIATNNTKRQSSIDEVQNVPKRSKDTSRAERSRSFSDVAKKRKMIGVLDRSHPKGRIPHNQWPRIVSALARVTMKVLLENPGPVPVFTDAGWFQGTVKIIACEDERSAKLYKIGINKIGEVYPGAKLEVCDARDIPSSPIARALIPASTSEPKEILQILQMFNPSFPTYNWKVIKVEQAVVDEKRQVEVLLNNESLQPLAERDGILSYGFSNIKFNVYKADAENLNAWIEPPSDDEKEVGEADPNGSEYSAFLQSIKCELLSESNEFNT